MVTIETKYSKLTEAIEKKISLKELEEVLFDMGLELETIEKDDIKISVTAERTDLLSTYGLARAIRSYIGIKNKPYKITKSNDKLIIKSPLKEWPYSVAAVVKNLKLDDEKVKEIIRIQEKLGATFLRNRKKGGLGGYPLDKIKFPVTFTSEEAKKIKFKPLGYDTKINALEILELHPTGIKYKDVVKNWKNLPIFKDADGEIMSMPPIVNSDELGKVNEKTTGLFIEVSGIDQNAINITLNVITCALIDMGGEAYSLEVINGSNKTISPALKEEKRSIKLDYVNKILGTNFKSNEVKKYLEKMDYVVEKTETNEVSFLVPATRSDIWHDVDIVDDIARAHGFNNFELSLKPIDGIGGTTREVKLKETISSLLVGLGYQEMFTLILSSKQDQFDKMGLKDQKHVALGNSVEEGLNMPRKWLTPELLKCLKSNRSVEYPQNIFEINQVITLDETRDVKSRDLLKLCVMLTSRNVTFTAIKQVLDFLFNSLDLNYEIEQLTHPSFIQGRAGKISVNNQEIGIIGEIHPVILNNFELENPVSSLEIDLTELLKNLK